MNPFDKILRTLDTIRLDLIRSKTDSELLAILLEVEQSDEDYLNLVKNEITKRLIN